MSETSFEKRISPGGKLSRMLSVRPSEPAIACRVIPTLQISAADLCLEVMSLLKTLIARHGPEKGKAKYNEYHREYRKRNKRKTLNYWVELRAEKKN